MPALQHPLGGPRYPPDDFYLAVGRIVVAATQLQAIVGSIGHAANCGSTADNSWILASDGVGKASNAMKRLIAQHPEDTELVEFWDSCAEVFSGRNDIAHSVLMRDDHSGWRQDDPTWSLLQAANAMPRALTTFDEANRLVAKIEVLCKVGYGMAQRFRLDPR